VSPSTARAILKAAVVWLSVVQGTHGEPAAAPPSIGGPAPNFALTTQQNDRLWLTHLRGRMVVLAFGCAACGACPELVPRLGDLAGTLGDAPGRRIFFVLVTLDPARDTPAALREFGRLHGLRAPAWLFLTEDRAGQVEAVARRYGVAMNPAAGGPAFQCVVTLIDAGGRIRGRYDPGSLEALDHELRSVRGLSSSP
jgi:protein SCO1